MKTPKTEPLSSVPSPSAGSELRMSGPNARIIIQNCHAILRHKFRQVPLWSMVGSITGHGSGNSAAICESANLDPHQSAGVKTLRDHIPNAEVSHAARGKRTETTEDDAGGVGLH